ncbi:hypothetical protein N665_0220s0020 [Sinapis alba]|nr:hypothetical protein N665_0220s0020 [Sinapis alba]
MDSSKLLLTFMLVEGIGINARIVPPTCYEGCNATFHNPECNKKFIGLAYKDGSRFDPEGPSKGRSYYRCCCNPIILSPPSL